MLQRVNPGHKSLADYRSIIHRELYDEVVALSDRLKGARVLHVTDGLLVETLGLFLLLPLLLRTRRVIAA